MAHVQIIKIIYLYLDHVKGSRSKKIIVFSYGRHEMDGSYKMTTLPPLIRVCRFLKTFLKARAMVCFRYQGPGW